MLKMVGVRLKRTSVENPMEGKGTVNSPGFVLYVDLYHTKQIAQ